MADIDSSQPIQSISSGNSVKISSDLNANAVGNTIFVELSDGVNAADYVVINSAYGATPVAFPIAGKFEATPTTYGDNDAVPLLTNLNGKLRVVTESASGADAAVSYPDDSAFTIASDNVNTVGGIHRTVGDSVDDGDTGAFWMTADRRQYVQPFDGTNAMPMMDANTRAGFFQPTDGANDLDYVVINSAYGATPTTTPIAGKFESTPTTYDDGDATPFQTSAKGKLQSIISANDSANSETNPIFAQLVEGVVSGIEVIDYDTASAVAASATSNHDFTVTSAKTLKVKRVFGSASGAQKIEIQSGPLASLTTRAVQFTSQAALNWSATFEGLLEVPDTSTGTLRLIRTNRESGLAQDLYSTIIGTEV